MMLFQFLARWTCIKMPALVSRSARATKRSRFIKPNVNTFSRSINILIENYIAVIESVLDSFRSIWLECAQAEKGDATHSLVLSLDSRKE